MTPHLQERNVVRQVRDLMKAHDWRYVRIPIAMYGDSAIPKWLSCTPLLSIQSESQRVHTQTQGIYLWHVEYAPEFSSLKASFPISVTFTPKPCLFRFSLNWLILIRAFAWTAMQRGDVVIMQYRYR